MGGHPIPASGGAPLVIDFPFASGFPIHAPIMLSTPYFRAPWAASLKLMTVLLVALLLGIVLIGLFGGDIDNGLWLLAMVMMPLLILLVAMAFMIRGYDLEANTLRVHRLGWYTRLDLAGLSSVEADPVAMMGSTRVFGNGGLFCFAGRFRNRQLGTYRAFATDPRQAVVLRLRDRTVVITPDDPEKFLDEVRKILSP